MKSWRRIAFTDENLVVYTDIQGDGALAWARTLAETRATMQSMVWPNSKPSPSPTVVLMFRRPVDAAPYMPVGAKAVADRTLLYNGVVVFSPGSTGIQEVISHELAHDMSLWYMPVQPLWFAEGLATFLQTVRYDASSGQGTLGVMPSDVRESKALAKDWSIQGTLDKEQLEHSLRAYGFYVVAYGIFTNLLNRHEDAFADFQRELVHMQPWKTAWQMHLSEVTPEQLGKELGTKGDFSTLTRSVRPINSEVRVTPLSPAQAHGLFAAASSWNPERSLAEARAALEEDPNELLALSVLFDKGNLPLAEKRRIAEQTQKAHPASAHGWLMAFDIAENDAQRVAAAEKAVALEPFSAAARLRRAQAKILTGHAEAALGDSELAIRLGGVTAAGLRLHVIALAANKRCGQARDLALNDIRGATPKELEFLRAGDTPAERQCALEARGR